jgi:hypothetical protein
MLDTNIFKGQYKRMPKKKKTGGANKGKKLVQGLRRAGSKVEARSDASAQKGVYVTADEFERLQLIAGSNLKNARTEEERQLLASALRTIRSEIERTTDEFKEDTRPGEEPATQLAIMDVTTETVRQTASQMNPDEGTALLAVLASHIERVTSRSEEEEQQKQKLLADVDESQSDMVRRLQQNESLLRQQPEVSRTVRELFGKNPATSSAAPIPVSPRPVATGDLEERSDSDDEQEEQVPPEQSPASVFSDAQEQHTPRQSPEGANDDSVYNSPIVQAGILQRSIDMVKWAAGAAGAPADLKEDVQEAAEDVQQIVDSRLEEMTDGDLGDDSEEDADAFADITDRILETSAVYEQGDESELAAATLVAGHEYMQDAQEISRSRAVPEQSARILRALDRQPPSTVKRGFSSGFEQSTSAPLSSAGDATPQQAARDVDGASYPHVATAAAQAAATAAAAAQHAGPPPAVGPRPRQNAPVAAGAAAIAQNAVVQQQQMAATQPQCRARSHWCC